MTPDKYKNLVRAVAEDTQFQTVLETNDSLKTLYTTPQPDVVLEELTNKWRILQVYAELTEIVPVFSPVIWGAYIFQMVTFDQTQTGPVLLRIAQEWKYPEMMLEKFKSHLDDQFVDKAMNKTLPGPRGVKKARRR